MTDRMTKQESSIPVQSRASIISLAELAKYWETTEYEMRSMSQLISWSLDLLRDILKANKMIGTSDEIESVMEARDYLVDRHLWQAKVAKRAFTKIGNAVRFQGFRDLGENPETRDGMSKIGHNLMHNKHSVSPYRDRYKSDREKLVERATEKYHEMFPPEEPVKLSQEEARAGFFKRVTEVKREHPELSDEEVKVKVQAEMKGEMFVPDSGPVVKEGMTDEEYEVMMKNREKRDLKRLELENAPFEASDLPIVGK